MAKETAKNGNGSLLAADPELVAYIKAGYSLLYMLTHEEGRAEREIVRIAEATERQIAVWSVTEGLTYLTKKAAPLKINDPVEVLKKMQDKGESDTIYVLRDMHSFFTNPIVVRHLRDIARDFKQRRCNAIILTPVNKLPPELDRDAVIVDFNLPSQEQMAEFWDYLAESNEPLFKSVGVTINEDERDRILHAAMGLTANEAENAFSKAIVKSLRSTKDRNDAIAKAKTLKGKDGAEALAKAEEMKSVPIAEVVMREKATAVKKNGILEYFEAKERASDIGGLDSLKTWFDIRSRAFTRAAREFGLPTPKGILLVGLPGCGKSLTAKAASNILQVPLVRFDISRVFGGIVGQSETQMRGALQTIDRVGNCVCWIDEADKAFAGVGGSGSNDSGVTKRVFGNFLTWMQEKQGESFVVMTVNNIEGIRHGAPELLRKGRFDEIFFVGLPSHEEREAIFHIHISKVKRDPANYKLKKLAELTDGFSGAEIEMTVLDGLFRAFYEGKDLQDSHIMKSISSTNPLSKSSGDTLAAMREWAENNAVNASSNGKDEGHAGRQLNI